MIAVVTGFAAATTDLGFGAAIIQRKELDSEQVNSAFWVSLALGCVIAILAAMTAEPVAAFFGNSKLVGLMRLASIDFIFSSIIVVPRAILLRNLEVRSTVLVDSLGVTIGIGISLVAALFIRGAWPLVMGPIAGHAATAAMYLFVGQWRPRLDLDIRSLRSLAHVGLYLTGFTIVNYWARNFDNLIVGKWLGAEQLAFYARAYSLMLLPISFVAGSLGDTIISALSQLQDDRQRCRSLYLRAQRGSTFIVFPAMLGLSILAEPFVETIFGAQWLPMTPTLRILALVSLLQIVSHPTGWIYISQGQTRLMFRWVLIASTVLLPGIYAGALSGSAASVAAGYGLASCIVMYPCLWIAGRLIELSVEVIVFNVMPSVVCAVAMAIPVWSMLQLLRPSVPAPVVLIACTVLGVIVYLGIAMVAKIRALDDILFFLRVRGRLSNDR
jgi:PST family polysaccharide transporter